MLAYYLLLGFILGAAVTVGHQLTSTPESRRRTLFEMLATTIVGTVTFAMWLPVSIPLALCIAWSFSVINQIPKAYFRTAHGKEIADMLGFLPPTIFFVIMITGSAWYFAFLALTTWLAPESSLDGAVANLTLLYSFITWITVGLGYLFRDITL